MRHSSDAPVFEHGHSLDLEDVPCTSGVYAFITSTGAVRYVGHAGPRRLYHEAKASFYSRKKGRRGDSVMWFVTPDKAQARELERQLIADLSPPLNGVEVAKTKPALPRWAWDALSLAWTVAGVVGLATMIDWAWDHWGDQLKEWYRDITKD